MAKSIYETLESLQTETSVPKVVDNNGKELRKNMGTVSHTLPREQLPTAEVFEDEEKLLAFARETGNLHACLQSGYQGRLIDYRAIFKAMPKKSDLDKGIKWTPEYGQKAVDAAKWKVVSRPNTNTKEAAVKAATMEANTKTAQAMKENGVDDTTILTILTSTCGAEMATEIIKTL